MFRLVLRLLLLLLTVLPHRASNRHQTQHTARFLFTFYQHHHQPTIRNQRCFAPHGSYATGAPCHRSFAGHHHHHQQHHRRRRRCRIDDTSNFKIRFISAAELSEAEGDRRPTAAESSAGSVGNIELPLAGKFWWQSGPSSEDGRGPSRWARGRDGSPLEEPPLPTLRKDKRRLFRRLRGNAT